MTAFTHADLLHHLSVEHQRPAAPHFESVEDALAFNPAPGDEIYHRVWDAMTDADALGGHYVLQRADGSRERVIARSYTDIASVLHANPGASLEALA